MNGVNPPWWMSQAYRNPALRYAAIEQDRMRMRLVLRRAQCPRHSLAALAWSIALAGAAAASRMTTLSLSTALDCLDDPMLLAWARMRLLWP